MNIKLFKNEKYRRVHREVNIYIEAMTNATEI